MENTIASQNASRLAKLSALFCAINGLETADVDLVPALANAVLSGCARWCKENGQEFSPATTLIPDDALVYAFGRVQEIAILANVAASSGLDLDALMS